MKPSAFPHLYGANLMVSFFKDVKTIHLFNIPYDGKVPVAPYIKHFHDCLGTSFTVATVVQQNARFSQEAIRNSHAEAYLVYVDAPVEYFAVLETVKSTNPLARCLFVFSKGSYSEAVERLRLAWERFELFNIVISSIDGGNGAMIVNNILLGSLIEYLNVPVFNEIDSLSKLLNANINIVTVPFIFNSLQHVTGDRTVQQIKTKLKIMPLPQNRDNPIFTNGRHAFLLPKEKAHSMAETIYDDHGNDLLFIVPEKVHVFYVAFVARRDLFMEWKINQLILQMAQHGIIHYEFESMFSSVRLLQIHRVREGKVAETELLTIRLGDVIKMLPLCLLEADINIVTVPFVYTSFEHVTGDHIMQRIKAKLRVMPFPEDSKDPIFKEGRHAFLLPKEKAHSMAETIYDDQGNDLIYVVPEKIHALYVAFVARRELSFAWKIDELILQMLQHGIVQYEFDRMFMAVKLLQIERVRQGKVLVF
ncbi:hypothetical protein pipiens_003169 [Culex pipiens pipiens]|uniref:Ionotropic receptor n=1 Tax=Culex pipiens pipiens TaxID=38569 RepID=A0ABD1D2Z8_CULPP